MSIEVTGSALEVVTNAGVLLVGLIRLGIWFARNRRNRLRRIVREDLRAMQFEACEPRPRLRYLADR